MAAPRTETPWLAMGDGRSNIGSAVSWESLAWRWPRRFAVALLSSGQVRALMCASVCDPHSTRPCMDSVPRCCIIALIQKKLLKSASPVPPPLNSPLTDAVPLRTIVSPRKCACATRRFPSVRADHLCRIMLNEMCGWRFGLPQSRLRGKCDVHWDVTTSTWPWVRRTRGVNVERGLSRSAGPPFIASWRGTPNGVAHALHKPNRVSCSPPCAGRTQPCAPSPWPFGGL